MTTTFQFSEHPYLQSPTGQAAARNSSTCSRASSSCTLYAGASSDRSCPSKILASVCGSALWRLLRPTSPSPVSAGIATNGTYSTAGTAEPLRNLGREATQQQQTVKVYATSRSYNARCVTEDVRTCIRLCGARRSPAPPAPRGASPAPPRSAPRSPADPFHIHPFINKGKTVTNRVH